MPLLRAKSLRCRKAGLYAAILGSLGAEDLGSFRAILELPGRFADRLRRLMALAPLETERWQDAATCLGLDGQHLLSSKGAGYAAARRTCAAFVVADYRKMNDRAERDVLYASGIFSTIRLLSSP